jgi:hypothetical protein
MRHLAGGVRKSTGRQLMLREFGCHPLARIWVHSMVSLWNRVVASRDDCLLQIATLEGISLGGNCSWYSGSLSVLSRFGGAPRLACARLGYLRYPRPTGCQSPNARHSPGLDSRFYSGWCDIPADPRTAEEGTLCKYQQSFATQGGPLVDPTALLSEGRWQETPSYVRYTAGIKRDRLHALTCFRLV